MKKMNGAEVILRMLELHGVEHVFGLPGETTIGWYKEWQKSSDIKFVLTRDERTASYAAEAYAKITGKPAVLEAPSLVSPTARRESRKLFFLRCPSSISAPTFRSTRTRSMA